MMAGLKVWLALACIFFNVRANQAQETGLSAVTEARQELDGYYGSVKNWVHSGRPGLFMSDDFNKTENSTFRIRKAGVYYVSANLIIEAQRRYSYYSYYYYRTVTFQGEIHLTSDNSYVDYNKHLSTYVTMGRNEQKNLRISGYIQLEEGWDVTVKLDYSYRWKRIIKAGSTLSLIYVSKPSMFPGVLLKNDYEYLHLDSPSYSANVVDWNEIDEGSAFAGSEGDIIIPHNGLYHVLVNLNIRRYSDITMDFGIVINNKTEAISKRTKIDSQGRNTIILEGILNLQAKQIISIKISNPASFSAYIRVDSSSTFFIFSKGALSPSTPALSVHHRYSSKERPANKFSQLKSWNTTSNPSLDHYSNVQLKQSEFVAPKAGFYQVNMALYLSNCTTAEAKLSVKKSGRNDYNAISPDISLTKESNDCYLENSVILSLAKDDTLRLEVRSDVQYTVLSQTSYQVLFQNDKHSLWPAAILKLENSFKFNTNSAPAKVQNWTHHNEGNWNDLFFQTNKEKIIIPLPGLYLLSYNLIVKPAASGAQFHSEIIVNGSRALEGSMCQRGSTPSVSTCTTSMLMNLNEKTTLALHVWMKDSSKKKVEVSNSSRITIISLGHTRSHPTFKLNVKAPSTAYSVKAASTLTKSLTEYTFPNTSFFQSGPLYSSKKKTFHGGENIGFLLLNNMQYDLQNDGYLASVVGSKKSNMMVYSKDHEKSHFSLSASDVTLDSQFYFNVSAEAKKTTALKWQPEAGSVASGVYLAKKETMIYVKAQLKPTTSNDQATTRCSSQWTQIAIADWNPPAQLNNFGKITKTGLQISRSGFYLTSLNFAVTANTSGTVIDVAIFVDKDILLSASETSPTDGKFSVFLQGVAEAASGQNIEVKVKCTKPTLLTYANGGGISSVKVDELQSSPGMRRRFDEDHYHADEGGIGNFYPRYFYSNGNLEVFNQGISNDDWKLSVTRDGVYFISAVGYTHTYSTGNNFELGFLNHANDSESAACFLDSSPLSFKDSRNREDESIALTGFALLSKDDVSGFLGRYAYHSVSYKSRYYMSLQFVGDTETSNSFIANLEKDIVLAKGENKQFKGNWISGDTCGQFRTRDVPAKMEKYRVLYSGYYMVAMNFLLEHKDGSNIGFCFTINGKTINAGGVKNVGCFTRHLKTENHTSISTVSNSELLYLEEGDDLSVQWSTSLKITISKKSSFSVFYLGTAGAILGTSWVMTKAAKLLELPTYSLQYRYHYHYYYHYYDDDREYSQHLVKGWQASAANTEMFFQHGVKTRIEDMFVSPQDGVYVVLVKLHVKGEHQTNETCGVKLQLAVDGEVLDFAFKDDITGTRNTLSFTTTLRLEKWQGVTVRVSWGLSECINMGVEPGSSFAVVYLDSGKKAFTLWPNIGPHIVDFPAENTVYVREDKDDTKMLKCTAVGEHPITYEWKTYSRVVSDSNTLDTTKLNESSYVQCVATMQGLVAESMFITIRAIDPTVIFTDTFHNRTYELPEKNETTQFGYKDVLTFAAREKKSGYYYWYWSRRINCSITKGNTNNTFMITYDSYYYGWGDDDQDFKLRANLQKLDREKISEYYLQITCENLEYSDAAPATTTIHVQVLDVNDNLPVFEKEIYKVKVPTNVHAGENIIQVMATDDDADENGKIKYSLVYTADSYIFSIDKSYGVISLKTNERLSRPYYTLTAVATDQGKTPRSAYVTVIIEVQDGGSTPTNHTNTNTNPVFPQRKYYAYLIPGTPIGTVVTTVHAHDPFTFAHENIRYYLFSGDDSVFKVNSKTGQITTKGVVTRIEYQLEIAAEYSSRPGQRPGEHYNTTQVIVLLRPVSTPNFVKKVYNVDIPENAKTNTKVVKVKAIYNKALVYTALSSSKEFRLNSTTGQITLVGKLDYETRKYYAIVVQAESPSETGKAGLTTVVIHVTDINDNAPVIDDYPKDPIHVDVSKVGQKVCHVGATDKDDEQNSKIRYYLEDDYNIFSINPVSGELFVDRRCCDGNFTLTVEATDQGTPAQHDEVQITVILHYLSPTHSPSHGHHSHHHDHTHGPDGPKPSHGASKSSSSQTKYVIIGAVGGVAVIIILVGVLYWRRRRRQRNYPRMNYLSLPTDEDDEELLDPVSDNEDNDNEGRLSLISAASDDNLLRNEEPC